MLSHPLEQTAGKVYLVGAGPGDPDLLTVKAVRTLGLATIVLHDALVPAEILVLVSSRAKVVNVGKRCGKKSISQDEINKLLIRYAMRGEVVVRLKSGDPLIFGRAGEELDVLKRAGIEVEIVPGITSALAAAASMKTSLTDRRRADRLLIVSAHHRQGKDGSDWQKLVDSRTTVVVYMPGESAGVAEGLLRAGLMRTTPCAIVSKVSTPEEQRFQTTLGALPYAPRMASPCILIVGETLATTQSSELLVANAQENILDQIASLGFGHSVTTLDDGQNVLLDLQRADRAAVSGYGPPSSSHATLAAE